MALPVLDGNQSATTLSSVVTGGEHIVAHSVVSLGATAISNINSAVSGTAVTIPGLARLGSSIASDNTADANLDFIKIGGHQDGQNQVAHIVHVSAGGAMKVDASGSSVTFSQAPVTFGAITGSASILNFPSTQTIAGTVTANVLGKSVNDGSDPQFPPLPLIGFDEAIQDAARGFVIPVQLTNTNGSILNEVPISGTVTVGNSVTIGSLPAISGTVTANVFGNLNHSSGSYSGNVVPVQIIRTDDDVAGLAGAPLIVAFDSNSGSTTVTVSNSVTIGSLPAISGTVTVGNSVTIGSFATSVTARLINPAGTAVTYAEVGTAGSPSIDVLSVQGVSGGTSLPISGTAGTLTTRFGSVTTANTAQISSAVTNTSRKYLLVQNVTTSSNVITVGIGFTPTTTQGIQLSAGAGITFESSYIPTGAVYILSSVTASPFTILEA